MSEEILTRWQDPTIEDLKKENNKQKAVLDKIKELMIEYRYTNIEDYSRIMEFYRKLEKLLEEIE